MDDGDKITVGLQRWPKELEHIFLILGLYIFPGIHLLVVLALLAVVKFELHNGDDDAAYIACAASVFVSVGGYSFTKGKIAKHLATMTAVTLLQFRYYSDDISIGQEFGFIPAGVWMCVEIFEYMFMRTSWAEIPEIEGVRDGEIKLLAADDAYSRRHPGVLARIADDEVFRDYYGRIVNFLLTGWVLLPLRRVGLLNMSWEMVCVFACVWLLFAIRCERNSRDFKVFDVSDAAAKCCVLLYLPYHAYLFVVTVAAVDLAYHRAKKETK